MTDNYSILHPIGIARTAISLPSSKSESNRALIINALTGNQCKLENLSSARDTQTLINLLQSDNDVLDVLDAGTTMRFLTAYCAVKNKHVVLTGTPRMKERPISILVNSLRDLGAEIQYIENEGFPPIKTQGFSLKTNKISIRGDVSSQYISALLMVAPYLPEGLTLELIGKIASRPYIEMTLQLMQYFGAKCYFTDNKIIVEPTKYKATNYFVESDWSGASYWFSIAAFAKDSKIHLKGLKKNSLQGDSKIIEIGKMLGISSEFDEHGLWVSKDKADCKIFEYNFSDCPDLAQTIAVICAGLGIEAKMHGLESLRIKETDRIAAIQHELLKFGIIAQAIGDETLLIPSQKISVNNQLVATYHDHRMAMAFAPLALLGKIGIEAPQVVAKSYPSFWNDLKNAGFEIDNI